MPETEHTKEDVIRRGKDIYAHALRARLEPAQNGRFVAIDVASGDSEVADEVLQAVDRLRARRPGVLPYVHRVGYPAAYKLGGRFQVRQRP
jgi:hypothetical protein